MWKGILYTVITIIFYYLISTGLTLVLSLDDSIEFLSNINESVLLFINSFFYLFLISIIFIFLSIYKVRRYSVTKSKISLKAIFQILSIVVIMRIIEDPLLRMSTIIENVNIPTVEVQKIISFPELISIIFGVVLLGPVFEEILFRKIMLSFYTKEHLIVGILLSSFIFAFTHFNDSFTNYLSFFFSFMFGIVACCVYLKKGLFYGILFHVSYNMLWLILQEHEKAYWYVLQVLNFGVWYWLIIMTSMSLFLYIGYEYSCPFILKRKTPR